MLTCSAYPVEYIAGIDLYNAGEFHAAHDAWEERWMGEVGPKEKLFLQAMIQSAVAFHHLDIGRPGAARQMYLRAKGKVCAFGCACFYVAGSRRVSGTTRSCVVVVVECGGSERVADATANSPPKIRLLATVDEFD